MVFESSIYPFISVASPAYQDAQHPAEHTRIRLGLWMMLKSLERQSLSANHFQSLICSYLHYKLNPAGLTRRHLALCWRPRSDRELRCPSNLFTSADRPSTGCLKKKKSEQSLVLCSSKQSEEFGQNSLIVFPVTL